MALGATEIYEAAFGKQVNALAAGQIVTVRLGVDVQLGHAWFIHFALGLWAEFQTDTAAREGYCSAMSKTEIVAELPKLTPAEREEIRLKLAELDGNDWLDEDDPLTASDKALIESRVESHEKNPETAVPWAEFETRLKRRMGE